MRNPLPPAAVSTAASLLLLLALPCTGLAQGSSTRYVNPQGLVKPTGYTHVVVAPDGRTVYIAGQVAFDSAGAVVGIGDFTAQAEQVYRNLERALQSVGGTMADLVKTTTFITDVKNLPSLRQVRSRRLSKTQPPANTLLEVSSLARPDLLIEIEAVAVLNTIIRQ
jgi:enamine deaminase RidA (YjgF/YER057c/UK114 family)